MASEGKRAENQRESVEELVERLDAGALRTFVISVARESEAFERELRSSFEPVSAEQAARELERVTESLWNKYERGDYITWRDAGDFEREYGAAVRTIVRPFLLAGDAGALIDLALPRLAQLQRICIDDSNGFYTEALCDVGDDLSRAFELADLRQKMRLFEILLGILDESPGKDYADIYEYEQELAMGFLKERYARNTRVAPAVIELANQQVDWLTAELGDRRGYGIYDRSAWARMCLAARATHGDAPDELRAYAEKYELMEDADTIKMLASAYEATGELREAASIVRTNLNARESRYGNHFMRLSAEEPRLVEYLEKLAGACYDKAELATLYCELLTRNWNTAHYRNISNADLGHWYDELRHLVDDALWDDARARLLGAVPYGTANALLAHEGSYEELYQRIMANNGNGLTAYESVLADVHPEPYVDYYLGQVKRSVDRSSNRRAYNRLASTLAHAASIKGGKNRAQALAETIKAEYPRRTAMLDELRKAGFEV